MTRADAQRIAATTSSNLCNLLLAVAAVEVIGIVVWVLLEGLPLRSYLGLLRHGRDLVIYFYWMYLALTFLMFAAGAVLWVCRKPRPKLLSPYFLVCLIVPGALSMYGVAHRSRDTLLPHASWVTAVVVWVLLLAQIAVSLRLIIRTQRGGRLLMSSILLLMLLFSNAVALVAGMSISGRWL